MSAEEKRHPEPIPPRRYAEPHPPPRDLPEPLPPPGLFSAEIPNFGPVIDPPFIDVPDFSQYLVPADPTPVEYEPLEPRINDEDRRQAMDLALASDRVMSKLHEKRYEVLQVVTRSPNRETDYPVVIIYNYTDDVVVEVTIDPARRAVREVTEERYQPPLADSEQSHALELVRDDNSLTEAGIDVGTGGGLIVEDVNVQSPRHGHRLVDLRFGPENRYLPTAFAIVDLSSREIVKTGLISEGAS